MLLLKIAFSLSVHCLQITHSIYIRSEVQGREALTTKRNFGRFLFGRGMAEGRRRKSRSRVSLFCFAALRKRSPD